MSCPALGTGADGLGGRPNRRDARATLLSTRLEKRLPDPTAQTRSKQLARCWAASCLSKRCNCQHCCRWRRWSDFAPHDDEWQHAGQLR